MSTADPKSAVYRRHSLLKRNPSHTRQEFSHYYENNHGPLAASLAGFRKFASRYIQNHVEDLPDGSEPLFDGVTMTTQVPREDYTRGFFNEPDYEIVKPDEIYLFDIKKTVSVLGREELFIDAPATPFKALLLTHEEAFSAMQVSSQARVVMNHLDRSTASALGFHSGSFEYNLLAEIWFASSEARDDAFKLVSSFNNGDGGKSYFLPVREVTIFAPEKPWQPV